jgi:F-type H+-transporting ATPase subunit delta
VLGRGVCRCRPGANAAAAAAAPSPIPAQAAGKRNDVSDSYAKALVELAEEKGRLEQVHADVDAVASLVKDNAKLRELLFNPVVDGDKKKKVLGKVSSEAGETRGAGEDGGAGSGAVAAAARAAAT